MKINLSLRMKMNADLVSYGSKVADIGCDHGYVAMWLSANKGCPIVIATDVKEGPLNRAKKNIKDYKVKGSIETRLGDGLDPISEGEVDTVLIAGMGGMTICEILSRGLDKLSSVDTLILQPQSDIEEVRRHIHKLDYRIDKESICMEDGKYYFSIRAVQGKEDEPYTDTEYRYSRLLSEEGGSVYKSYLRSVTDKLSDLLKTLDEPNIDIGERALARRDELKNQLKEMRNSFK